MHCRSYDKKIRCVFMPHSVVTINLKSMNDTRHKTHTQTHAHAHRFNSHCPVKPGFADITC